MEKRSVKSRVLPLVVNTALTVSFFSAANRLDKASENLKSKNKNFLSTVASGVSSTFKFVGGMCATFGTLATIANAGIKYEYTDEEVAKILECDDEEEE